MKVEVKKDMCLVIPNKDIKNLRETHQDQIKDITRAIDAERRDTGKKVLSDNHYIVCNEDEPYAKEVLDVILKGEEKKIEDENNNKIKCPKCSHDSEWSIVAGGSKVKCGYCNSIFNVPFYKKEKVTD